MIDKETRCAAAQEYHAKGLNCAQSILAAFQDMIALEEEQCFALASGFGGGMRCGSICGAISGCILVLGMLFPALPEDGPAGKKRSTALTQEFVRRFQERFIHKNCPDLLADHDLNGTEQVARLGVTNHCGILIVSAVEMLCEYIEELKEE